ncbi:MAG: isoprenyl transferase [Eubacteriales bacterium]|nr:isoprenyl transferase [Eubacteriales bacterium]
MNDTDLSKLQIPEHVAIIMDGNGRWAKKRGLPRTFGHKEGCKTVEQTVEDAARLGIRYLTVYAFSTENWKRSEEEVGALMQLFRYYMVRLLDVATKNNVRVKMIGDRRRFPEDIRKGIEKLEDQTAEATGLTFVIAVNYGGRDELRRAALAFAQDVKDGKREADEASFTEADLAGYLDTSFMPDPDLLIRTSGELRLSNFLLWQCAYSEIVVTDVLWPDFNRDVLIDAIAQFNQRSRRYGGV